MWNGSPKTGQWLRQAELKTELVWTETLKVPKSSCWKRAVNCAAELTLLKDWKRAATKTASSESLLCNLYQLLHLQRRAYLNERSPASLNPSLRSGLLPLGDSPARTCASFSLSTEWRFRAPGIVRRLCAVFFLIGESSWTGRSVSVLGAQCDSEGR